MTRQWRRRVQWLPVLLLVCVAANQHRLVYTENISPWSGGGFGMFSTTDAATDRHLHIYELSSSLRRELSLPFGLEEEARRALALPSQPRLHRLQCRLRDMLAIEPGSEIEIQIWSRYYDRESLRPYNHLLRHYRSPDAPQPC